MKDVERGIWHKQGKNSQLQSKFRQQTWKFITLNYYCKPLTENSLLLYSKVLLFSWFDPRISNIFVPHPFIMFLPQKQPYSGKHSLWLIEEVLSRLLPCLWAAIWTPCTLRLPVFVPIVLRPLLRLVKCEIIHFGDLWQKALSSWKFRIFCSVSFLRILRKNNSNYHRVNPN